MFDGTSGGKAASTSSDMTTAPFGRQRFRKCLFRLGQKSQARGGKFSSTDGAAVETDNRRHPMLYKAIAIALSALFIAVFQISAASAGGCGHGHRGFHAFQASLAHQQALKQSRARKAAQARSLAAAKQKKAAQIARAEKKAEAAKVAAAEPAPVTEETKTVAETTPVAEKQVNVAAVEQTCTKFIAETGTTVTVECAKQ
jgi:hypothetical protein